MIKGNSVNQKEEIPNTLHIFAATSELEAKIDYGVFTDTRIEKIPRVI
jgi:hypothetical protein